VKRSPLKIAVLVEFTQYRCSVPRGGLEEVTYPRLAIGPAMKRVDMLQVRRGYSNADLLIGFADGGSVDGFAGIQAAGGNAERAIHPARRFALEHADLIASREDDEDGGG